MNRREFLFKVTLKISSLAIALVGEIYSKLASQNNQLSITEYPINITLS